MKNNKRMTFQQKPSKQITDEMIYKQHKYLKLVAASPQPIPKRRREK